MAERTHCVSVRLSPAELIVLDEQRGRRQRGAHLRDSWHGVMPPVVPAVNVDAWRELSRTASNLNQIAANLNAGNAPDLPAIRSQLAAFRAALLGARM